MSTCGFKFKLDLKTNVSVLDQLNNAISEFRTPEMTEKELTEEINNWLSTPSGKLVIIKLKNTNYTEAINKMINGTYSASESVISLNEIDFQSNIEKCFGSNSLLETMRIKDFKRDIIQKLLFYTKNRTFDKKDIDKLKESWRGVKASLETESLTEQDKEAKISEIKSEVDNMNAADLFKDVLYYDKVLRNKEKNENFNNIINETYNLLFRSYAIVKSNEDLNESLIEFKESQYKILNRFLLREKRVKSPRSKYMDRNGNVDLTYVIDLLNKMDEYLNENKSDLSSRLLAISNSQANGLDCDELLLKAINAYLNLRHFDETLKDNFGDIINISNRYGFEVSKFFNGDRIIKYSLGQDTSTAVKGWYQGEFRNALAESTKLEKLFVQALSLVDYKTKRVTSDTIDLSKIAMSWYEFIQACQNLTQNDGKFAVFRDIVSKYNQNVNQYITDILNMVFDENNSDILLSLNLSKPVLNIIYSIYNIYLNSNVNENKNKENIIPVKYVEQQNIRTGEITLSQYLYQDVIFGIISRIIPANYQQTKIVNGIEVTEIASKHDSIRKDAFDFKDSHDIKLRRSTLEQRKALLDKYNVRFHYVNSRQDNSMMTITLGDRDYIIYIGSASNSKVAQSPLTSKDISTVVVPVFTEEERQLLNELGNELEIDESKYTSIEFWSRYSDDRTALSIKIKESNSPLKQRLLDVFKHTVLSQLDSDFGTLTTKQLLNDPGAKLQTQVIDFINDFLNLQLNTRYGLDILSTYRNQLNKSVLPLFHSAVKLAYKNKLFADYEEGLQLGKESQSFIDYVKSKDKYINDNPKEGYITKKVYDTVYLSALGNPTWVDAWFEAKGSLDGVDVQSVTKNANNDNIANFRSSSLGANIKEQLNDIKSSTENPAAKDTLFVQNPNLIIGYTYDSDLEAWDDSKKAIKKLNVNELLYHNILHNFWSRALCDGSNTISIMPTVYSDKTSFVQYIISTNTIVDENKTLLQLNTQELEYLYFKTVGSYFQNSYKAILSDLKTLFEFTEHIPLSSDLTSLAIEVNNILKRKSKADLENDIRLYQKAHPDSKLNIGNDVHYRENKKTKKLYLNELIHYYGTEQFKDIETLRNRFTIEKRQFLEELIKNRVRFYSDSAVLSDTVINTVIQNGDNILYPVDKNNKKADSIRKFKQKWFKQGRMILATTKGGKEIFTLSDLERATDIILNPILEKYFYVDTVVSANIKYALVGSEISDPIKGANLNLSKDLKPDNTQPKQVNIYNKYPEVFENLSKASLTDLKLLISEFKETIQNLQSNLEQSETDDQFVLSELAELAIGLDVPNFDNIQDARSWYQNYIKSNIKHESKFFDQELRRYLENKYNSLIYRVIATSESAQYKRNVIVPATSVIMTPGCISGLGETTKVAIFSDPQAHYFTLNGETGNIDADDGSAFINPFQAILENYSLNVNSVSFTNKKPIWHHYDKKTGTSVLLKFATFTLSNAQMLISQFSEYSHYKMFKKLTNLQWTQPVNLLHGDHLLQGGDNINFHKHILSGLSQSNLYYEENGEIKSIVDFIRDENGIYYTKEQIITPLNKNLVDGSTKLVAQLFTENTSDSFKVEQLEFETEEQFKDRVYKLKEQFNLHSINSLFELHASLGGIYSKELVDGEFVGSENSNYAVVAFMNTVTQANNPDDANPQSNQVHYKQLLKSSHIGYAANTSSVKRGQFNIQSEDIWTSDKAVIYTELSNKGLGKQQDTDHTADESTVSEMTQVVASLDVMGYTHEIARLAFQDLGKISAEGLRVETEVLLNLIAKSNNIDTTNQDELNKLRSDFYDLFGRNFIELFKARKLTDFSNVIIQAVKDTFLKSESHELDDYKLPISDPNIFNEVISSFLNTINKKSLKRKYPGLGAVLVPAYKKAQLFHINGKDLLSTDVIKLANLVYKGSNYYLNVIQSIASNAVSEQYEKVINGQSVTTFFVRTNPYPSIHNELDTNISNKYGIDIEGDVNSGFEISRTSTDEYTLNILNNNDEVFSDLDLVRISAALQKVLPIGSKIKISDSSLVNINFNNVLKIFNSLNYVFDQDNNFIITKTDQNVLNKLLSEKYLLELQAQQQVKSFRSFKPTDIVTIKDFHEVSIDLDNIYNYYKFKDNDWWYFIALNRPDKKISSEQYIENTKRQLEALLINKPLSMSNEEYMKSLLSDKEVLQKFDNFYLTLLVNNDFQNDVTKPQSLRPQIINFTINGNDANIFDLAVIRKAILSGEQNPEGVQKALLDLMEQNKAVMYIDKNNPAVEYIIDKDSISVEEAELLMSNIYQTKFGQGTKSLYESLQDFSPSNVEELSSNNAQLFLKGKEHNISISLTKPKDAHILKSIKTKIDKRDGSYKVMALSNTDNIYEPIYQQGLQIRSNDYTFETIDGKKIFKDKKKNEYVQLEYKNNKTYIAGTNVELIERNGEIYTTVNFVEKYQLVSNNKKPEIVYYFNTENIKKYLGEDQLSTYISDTIYQLQKYEQTIHIQLNSNISNDDKNITKNVLEKLSKDYTNVDHVFSESAEIALKALNNPVDNKYFTEQYKNDLTRLYFTIVEEIKSSYELSRYFIAARIPAQSLQSYMKMKLVGYIPISGNECMVSHWQTFLQGSDYDIDKAYLMGFEFDNNGKFLGWSPLFNYKNLKTLEMSLTLPTPSGIQFKQDNELFIIDINNDLLKIKDESSEILKLKYWSELITKVDSLAREKQLTIKTIDSAVKDEFNKLVSHENYKIPADLREDIYKNSVSSRIQQISSHPKNMVLSYSPITINQLREQANNSSSKGQLMYKLTGMNPATKFILQKQNMDGKDVIGISAVGEKIFMALSYYWNEGIRSKDISYKRRMKFESTTTRIHNRSIKRQDGSYKPEEITKYTIADVNWYNIPNANELQKAFINAENLRKELKKSNPNMGDLQIQAEVAKRIKNKSQADLMISQLLSAATDNAKELILSKINAGADFARVYLHLLILGYDISDIVAFMTSDAIETMTSLYEVSIFDETVNKSKVTDAIELAKGNIQLYKYVNEKETKALILSQLIYAHTSNDQSLFSKEVVDNILNKYLKEDFRKGMIKTLVDKKIYPQEILTPLSNSELLLKYITYWDELKNPDGSKKHEGNKFTLERGILDIEKLDVTLNSLLNELFTTNTTVDKFLSLLDKYNNSSNLRKMFDIHLTVLEIVGNKIENADYMADLEEFAKIYEDSEETSNLGTLLGLNRGLKTDPAKFMQQIYLVEQMFTKQTNKYIVYDKENKSEIDKEKTLDSLIEKSGLSIEYINNLLQNGGWDILTQFDLQQFIDNKQYQQKALDIYDLVKSQYNIFDIVLRHENHNSAFNALSVGLSYITKSSVKGALLNEVRKSLQLQNTYLDESGFKKVINYCDELLIAKFLKQENIFFTLNKGQKYYDENFDVLEATEEQNMALDTSHGRASFKKWFEQYFLPQLQSGTVQIGNQVFNVDKHNSFLSYIVDGIEVGFPIKKLSINMGQIEKSTRIAQQLNLATQGFNTLDKQLQDIIMLYTLLVTKNNPGNDRFTSLFSQTFDKSNNINYRYSQFLGEYDHKVSTTKNTFDLLSEFDYALDDVQFKLAKIYTPRNIKYAYEQYILYNENGTLVYKKLTNRYAYGINKYSDLTGTSNFKMFTKNKSLSDRLRNFRDDGIIFLPGNDMLKTVIQQIKSNNKELVMQALRSLINSNLLNIYIEC